MTRLLLNLGCGTKTSERPEVVNIDWSIYLRLKASVWLRPLVPVFVKGERRKRFDEIPNNILVHDLSIGIPFDSGTVSAVYHSHMLEHLDRDVVPVFLREVHRVLMVGGVHRIVVPDLALACTNYLNHVKACELDQGNIARHDSFVEPLLEQSVRRNAFGTSQQGPVRRMIENFVLGDARRRGETHQWMYDQFNLSQVLLDAGFASTKVQRYDSSLIPDWNMYGLDTDENGMQYKPNSLYLEAIK